MSYKSLIPIRIVADEDSEWRASDLLPGNGCTIGTDIYIKLGLGEAGSNNVELHCADENRMARGEAGSQFKKHFFFHVQTASIVALIGETKVVPHNIEVTLLERVTYTPSSTIPVDVPNPF